MLEFRPVHGLVAVLITAVLVAASAVVPVEAGKSSTKEPPPVDAGRIIDLNQATADELISLPGIGQTMARRIIDFREEHGPFRKVEDLLKVKGIGEKSFQKLRPFITVDERG